MKNSTQTLVAMVGSKVHRFTIDSYFVGAYSKTMFNCTCKCGSKKVVDPGRLLSGQTKSCGCFRREFIAARNTTHNAAYSHDYNLWCHIRQRCENPKNRQYKNYGARGISICDRWRNSFEDFISDMGPRPSRSHSIDRIDVNGDYEPENCRWIKKAEQSRNTRVNKWIEIEGQRMILADWARLAGVKPELISERLKRGWPVKDAVWISSSGKHRKIAA